jgi:hypothetical protein
LHTLLAVVDLTSLPEIDDLQKAAFTQHDVDRLDVGMHEAGRVQRIQPGSHLLEDGDEGVQPVGPGGLERQSPLRAGRVAVYDFRAGVPAPGEDEIVFGQFRHGGPTRELPTPRRK